MSTMSAESPCVRECTLDEQDVCTGCGRSLAEIVGWSAAPEPRKQDILALAAERLNTRRARQA